MTSFSRILGKIWKVKFHKVKLLKFKSFSFDLKLLWNWSFFHYEKIMRFKVSPQLPGAERTRAWHHHGSHRPTSPRAILLGKMPCHTKHFYRQCTNPIFFYCSVIIGWLDIFLVLKGSWISLYILYPDSAYIFQIYQ